MRPILVLAALAAAATPAAWAQTTPEADRGRLLYSTHCIECHNTEMHWRTHKQARDWDSLKAQVRRWQGTANLGWSEDDIAAVAGHLNRTIYQFPQPRQRASGTATFAQAVHAPAGAAVAQPWSGPQGHGYDGQ